MAAVALLFAVAMLTVWGQILNVLGGLANNVFLLSWGLTDLEVQMNSTQRLQKYHDNLPKEAQLQGLQVEIRPVPKDWPQRKSIDVQDMSLIHPIRSTPAADNPTLHIKSGERLGIVARTGRGKSTLIFEHRPPHRFRQREHQHWRRAATTHVLQPRLRTAVHTLPQGPLLFEGTVRDSSEPRRAQADSKILHFLERCRRAVTLTTTDGDHPTAVTAAAAFDILGTIVPGGGTDLLAGQRQLLVQPTILLVDEAVANIDHETDEALQGPLRALQLASTTAVAITHMGLSLA